MEIEQNKLLEDLDKSVKELRKSGTNYAKAEYEYKIKLRQEALKLRDDKIPVTLINQIIFGVPEVAKLRFDRDVAEAVYEANKEAINSIKLKLRIIESQISREYNNPRNGIGG